MAVIQKIHSKLGYVTVVDFFNAQMATPTPGAHTWFVDYLETALTVSDLWLFVVELYIEPSTYWGALVVFEEGLLIIEENLTPHYVNVNAGQVQSLFSFDETAGLLSFYSAQIPLTDSVNGLTHFLQCYNSITFGDQNWFVRVKDNTEDFYKGVINSRTLVDSVLGSYNIRIERLPFDLIEITSAKDQLMTFNVAITEGYSVNYTYRKRGEKMYVQDTVTARKRLKELSLQGVIYPI